MYKRKMFYSIFFKKSWGRGATPPARLARREILLRHKAQERVRKHLGDELPQDHRDQTTIILKANVARQMIFIYFIFIRDLSAGTLRLAGGFPCL